MNTAITITPINNQYCDRVVELILPIQQIEFNVPITLKDQPDLLDIETNYYQNGGCFWGAFAGEELIGTIALMDIGHEACAIRKMFVKKEYRGKETGTAQLLMDTLLNHCREKGITDVYLSTVDMLKAAHRFYERNGFYRKKLEEIPVYFPRMLSDNVYYHLHLAPSNNNG